MQDWQLLYTNLLTLFGEKTERIRQDAKTIQELRQAQIDADKRLTSLGELVIDQAQRLLAYAQYEKRWNQKQQKLYGELDELKELCNAYILVSDSECRENHPDGVCSYCGMEKLHAPDCDFGKAKSSLLARLGKPIEPSDKTIEQV